MAAHEAVCLSVRQPWAWLIVSGHKPVENRTWRTDYRGPLLIHAGGRMADREDVELANEMMDLLGIQAPEEYPLGGIVGCCLVTGCVSHSTNDWFCGPYALTLDRGRELPFRALKGRLGLFRVEATPEEWAAIEALRT